MTHSTLPIGVFDSGNGGLSVLAALRHALPAEHLLYFADAGHAPYGARTNGDLRRLTLGAARWLLDQPVKAVVIACNTACAAALPDVRALAGPDVPVIGLVPALKPALAMTRTGQVAVFATPVTLRGALLRDVIEGHARPQGVTVHLVAHPDLVPLIERAETSGPAVQAVLREALQPLTAAGVDTLVLGCTHYPFVRDEIEATFPGAFTVLVSGEAIARQTRRVLGERGLLSDARTGGVTLHSTGDDAAWARLAQLHALSETLASLPSPSVRSPVQDRSTAHST